MTETAAVLGASGYAGGELIRLLDRHPHLAAAYLGAHARAGERLSAVHPHLTGGDRVLGPSDADAVPDVGLAFLALPHGASSGVAMRLLGRGIRVVDLGSDFRLDSDDRYREAYGVAHPYPGELDRWSYGLPELFGDSVKGADRVAVPGCYPTSAVLGLGPLLAAGLVEPSGIIVNSMSGVSGAGRGLTSALLFGAVDESVRAYNVLGHRHQPEMESSLESLAGTPVSLLFTPHLVPMQRGILSTMYAVMAPDAARRQLVEALRNAFETSSFVSVVDDPPETRWVIGSNRAQLSLHVDERRRTAVVISAIDNLLKGAAGQAVQCANLMLGYPEETGLPLDGWMP